MFMRVDHQTWWDPQSFLLWPYQTANPISGWIKNVKNFFCCKVYFSLQNKRSDGKPNVNFLLCFWGSWNCIKMFIVQEVKYCQRRHYLAWANWFPCYIISSHTNLGQFRITVIIILTVSSSPFLTFQIYLVNVPHFCR